MKVHTNIFCILVGFVAVMAFFRTTVHAQAIGSPTPSPTPFDVPKTAPPELTIGTFYDAKKQTNPTFLLWGTGDALAQVAISIFPDNVSGSTMVDNVGRWQWTMPKSLTNGEKQLTIAITNDKGGQTVKTETFTVIGAFQFPTAAILFMLAIAAVVGMYVWMQMKKSGATVPKGGKQSTVPPQTPPTETPAASETSQPPAAPPAEKTA